MVGVVAVLVDGRILTQDCEGEGGEVESCVSSDWCLVITRACV